MEQLQHLRVLWMGAQVELEQPEHAGLDQDVVIAGDHAHLRSFEASSSLRGLTTAGAHCLTGKMDGCTVRGLSLNVPQCVLLHRCRSMQVRPCCERCSPEQNSAASARPGGDHLWKLVPAGLASAGVGVVHDVVSHKEEGLQLQCIVCQLVHQATEQLYIAGSHPFYAPAQHVCLKLLLLAWGLQRILGSVLSKDWA